jgi:hypothetical protein
LRALRRVAVALRAKSHTTASYAGILVLFVEDAVQSGVHPWAEVSLSSVDGCFR